MPGAQQDALGQARVGAEVHAELAPDQLALGREKGTRGRGGEVGHAISKRFGSSIPIWQRLSGANAISIPNGYPASSASTA